MTQPAGAEQGVILQAPLPFYSPYTWYFTAPEILRSAERTAYYDRHSQLLFWHAEAVSD